MTISTLVYQSSYTGDGLTDVFNINFPFDDDPDRIQVFLDDVLQSSGYTINDAGPNWVVDFIVAPANGVDIDIIRNTPITQDMDYVTGDPFPAESHEAALDKLTMIAQEISGRAGNAGGGGTLTDGSYGDISVSGGGTIITINPNVVDFGKIQDIGTGILGRSAGSGDTTLLSAAVVTGMLDTFTSIAKGLAPASGGGTANFLRADGSWATPSIVPVWGGIIGSITDQTDLMAQLNSKADATHTHIANDITDATSAGKAMLTAADAAAQTALLNVFSSSVKGLTPVSPGGTTTFLRADGTWQTPPGGGGGGGPPPDGDYGDVTISGAGTVIVINPDRVTNAKLDNMAASTVKGALVSGNPVDLTATELTTLINQFSSSLKGAVPASGGGSTNFLRADGSWTAPSVAWGSITGTLSGQTDLQSALDGKQTVDSFLTSIAALGTAADRIIYTTGVNTAAESAITLLGRQLLDDTTTGAMQATLGLVIGTNVQAADADLTTIAGLTATTNNIIQASSSAWSSRTPTQVTATLDAVVGDSGAGGTKGLVPAPAAGDAAAVKALGAGGTWLAVEPQGEYFAENNQTGTTYTFVLADKGKLVSGNNAAAQTFTVPPNSTAAFGVRTKIDLWQKGAGQITIAPGASVTLRSSGGKLKLTGQYSAATLVKIATDEWLVFGDLSA